MKRVLFKLGLLVVMVVAVVMLIGIKQYNNEIDLGARIATIIVKPGDSFAHVVNGLADEGVIKSVLPLKIAARLSGVDRKLTPGRYDFAGKNSCKSVLKKLEDADFLRIKVTIPEGSTIWQTSKNIAKAMDFDSSFLVTLNSDSSFLAQLQLPYLEGYLFPETYFFPWGSRPKEVVSELVAQFHRATDSLWTDSMIAGLTVPEIVILASIIEAETSEGDERSLVSSVYHNRLSRGMKLDADPTVIYGLGGLDRPLWKKDLKKDTPYNTYLHKGLPPTPINSPGLAAIRAALYPKKTDYLYFVADDTGGHRFSCTIAEHNRAIHDIRKHRQQSSP